MKLFKSNTLDWCCQGFQMSYSEAGNRGFAVAVRKSMSGEAFLFHLQHRSLDLAAPRPILQAGVRGEAAPVAEGEQAHRGCHVGEVGPARVRHLGGTITRRRLAPSSFDNPLVVRAAGPEEVFAGLERGRAASQKGGPPGPPFRERIYCRVKRTVRL